jgi:hypothetical protein
MSSTIDARLSRRLRHRSRSGAVAVVLLALAVALAWLALESALQALGLRALLVAPADAVATLNAADPWAIIVAGAAGAAGIVLIALALAPGRRPRHAVPDDRMAVVIDDVVLAGALKRSVGSEVAVRPDRVRSSVGRRRAEVTVIPTSGVSVDRERATAAASALLEALSPKPAVRPRVTISTEGMVGS